MLRDSVADFVARATDIARVRRMRAQGQECDRALWSRMAELGWLGILVPEACGGLGLGLSEAAIVAEGLGGALVPEPYTAVAVLSATALAQGSQTELRDRLLRELASGESLVALAWQEVAGDIDIGAIDARATPFEGGYRLEGVKRYVSGGAAADGYILTARVDDDVAMFWVPRQTPGVDVSSEPLADGRPSATVSLENALVPRAHDLARGAAARSALEAARDAATVIASAELLGVMQRALDMSLDYMRTRVQFGKPIGSFQALQHRAVDLYIQRQLASAVLEDGLRRYAGATDAHSRAVIASRVKARCSEAGLRIAREAIQIHGAIGFTDEYDAGLYLKRALVLAAWLGNAALHRRRYAKLALQHSDKLQVNS
ncbi:MAG: acyl-CoA dehydrogenase family protein [Rhodospirillaceae bacterium]